MQEGNQQNGEASNRTERVFVKVENCNDRLLSEIRLFFGIFPITVSKDLMDISPKILI